MVEFTAFSKRRVIKKIISYWYKELYNIITPKQFVLDCVYKKIGLKHIVIYNKS